MLDKLKVTELAAKKAVECMPANLLKRLRDSNDDLLLEDDEAADEVTSLVAICLEEAAQELGQEGEMHPDEMSEFFDSVFAILAD